MATDRFEYRSLPGVVSREQAESGLDFTNASATWEAGLVIAGCPICAGVLHCKLLPGDFLDLCCQEGCGARAVTVAVKERAEVVR